MIARIYKPSKTAMQSGRAKSADWVLEYERETPRAAEPLMGWTASTDMRAQIKLTFETKDEAEAYAKQHGLPYHVITPNERTVKRASYTDNFRYDRRVPWSH